jgi:hypothetical protein
MLSLMHSRTGRIVCMEAASGLPSTPLTNRVSKRAMCARIRFSAAPFINEMPAQSFADSGSTDIASERHERPSIDTGPGSKEQTTEYTSLPADEDATSYQVTTVSWFYRITLDTWAPEILALFISVASIGAITALLGWYKGKRSPELPYGITLNAIVSILATVSRSMLIFAVSMCIGQLKWCWYHERKRKVEDIQTMVRANIPPSAKCARRLS